MLGILFGSLQIILKGNLNIRHIAAKFVAHLVHEKLKENLVSMHQDLQGRLERGPVFLLKIVTGDEMWVYGYYLEIKQQSSQ
jgi:hypothetical protein